MANTWYTARDGKTAGPFTSPQLAELAKSGQLLPTDLVWKEGKTTWIPANTVKGLFPSSVPLPPAGQVGEWYIARDGQKVGPFSPAQLVEMAQSGQLQPDHMVWRKGAQKWVAANALNVLFPSAASPVAAASIEEDGLKLSEEAKQAKWYYKLRGEKVGPLTTDEFLAAVACGEVRPASRIKIRKVSKWIRASLISGLFKGGDLAHPDLCTMNEEEFDPDFWTEEDIDKIGEALDADELAIFLMPKGPRRDEYEQHLESVVEGLKERVRLFEELEELGLNEEEEDEEEPTLRKRAAPAPAASPGIVRRVGGALGGAALWLCGEIIAGTLDAGPKKRCRACNMPLLMSTSICPHCRTVC